MANTEKVVDPVDLLYNGIAAWPNKQVRPNVGIRAFKEFQESSNFDPE
jgi:hypothetical protein